MNLSELIHEVWKDDRVRAMKIRKHEVRVLIKVTIEHIVKGLLKNGKLKMQGLFTLEIKKAKGRKITNPQTKEHMYIDDYYKVGLEPSEALKKGLKKYKK